ncbi:tight adherence protein C [Agrococcus carbonis]|uniref:Tight adherence protein C n=1 Tax=Agrococcus carbonis TaxID=684552 RepID=A0A1H1S572_9MICO|nr:tight adherence protein C [Agrococcus carbonis]
MGAGSLVVVLDQTAFRGRSSIVRNLHRGDRAVVDERVAEGAGGLPHLARKLTPPPLVTLLARQHARAGRPADWTLERLLVVKMLVVPLGAALVAIAGLTGQDSVLVLVLALASVIGYFLPDLLLLSRGQERDQRIQLELADTLDQMTIAVEAGLAFDAAMSRAAANGKGALAEEFTRTLQDIRMGVSRAQAFKELGERNEVPDLRQFVRAILQADAFGISIGDVLRTQAAEMRLKRRQRAEEKAQQVPVKVVFPLIVCILPALFIVIMGPAVINIMSAFSNV